MREKLIDLLNSFECPWLEKSALCKENCHGCAADHLIENGVTIPVRCKDCTNAVVSTVQRGKLYCQPLCMRVDKDDFCSYGERKDNE